MTRSQTRPGARSNARARDAASRKARDVSLLDLLDRLVDGGVVLAGDITISVADVDLIVLGLRLVLASVERAQQLRSEGIELIGPPGQGAPHG